MSFDYWTKRASGLLLPNMNFGSRRPCPGCCDPGCCDPERCFYFQDDFDRGDSGDLGSDWSEEAGAWSIASNQLATDSSNAVAIAQTAGSIPYVVQCRITGLSGDELRVIACYQDTDNYVFAQLTYGATISTLYLYSRSGGVDTELASGAFTHASGAALDIKICVKSGVVQVDSKTSAWVRRFTEYTTTATGTAGCGTGSTSNTASFGSFSIQKHSETLTGCPDCKRPCTACVDAVTPDAFQAIISGVTQGAGQDADCPNMNGTWVLTQSLTRGCAYASDVQPWTTNSSCYPAGNWVGLLIWTASSICDPEGDNYAIGVFLSGASTICDMACDGHYFRHSQVAKYDCPSIDGLSLPPKSQSTCTVTGASCLITAL